MDSDVAVPEEGWNELMGKDIMVRTLDEGTGEIANMGTVVKCRLTGYFEGTDTIFEPSNVQRFKIGEGDAIPGLELSLRHSKVGARFEVKVNYRFGFGQGRPAVDLGGGKSTLPILPQTNLRYTVEVLSHIIEGDIDPELFDNNEEFKRRAFQQEHTEEQVANIRRLVALWGKFY
jgi:hypothetical protein